MKSKYADSVKYYPGVKAKLLEGKRNTATLHILFDHIGQVMTKGSPYITLNQMQVGRELGMINTAVSRAIAGLVEVDLLRKVGRYNYMVNPFVMTTINQDRLPQVWAKWLETATPGQEQKDARIAAIQQAIQVDASKRPFHDHCEDLSDDCYPY